MSPLANTVAALTSAFEKTPTCLTRCAHSSYAGLIKLIPTNLGRFGPIPVRSGRFGPGRFDPISGVSRFDPVGVGRFGPIS